MSLENMVCFVHLEELEKNGEKPLDLATMKDFEKNYIENNAIYEINIASSLKKSFYDLMRRCENSSQVNKSGTELSQFGESKENLNVDSSLPKVKELIDLLKTSILQNLGDTLSRLETTSQFKHWYEVYNIQSKNQV
ncbi:predicted protein [Naegleria gruberi]|uniref:Predicted protein n=1 Tax=Naegleria gruberi TaxID=5762 RepID=D2VBZ0_NAEGR|nr:uncharacterized protein NAEGRDRAFT_66386 [Naegleria gruberi]EFC45563.1 predicted protein [Naegleria gruberi]|eukprot:XP_002678307.1 predicted protein [Naegleria gruberi strain NEG-M]